MNTTTPIDGSGKGYIRLHRKLLEHPLFKDKPAAWLKIWLYILLRANWRESDFRPRQGESIVVPAGSLITSLEKLGTHAGLSKEHARRCLEYLERTHSVTLQRTHHWTMITIANWAAYQQSDDEASHTEHHAEHHSEAQDATRETPHQTPHAATPSKEVKNLSKKYKSNSGELDSNAANDQPKPKRTIPAGPIGIDPAVQEWFETDFWPIYPAARREAACAQGGECESDHARDTRLLLGSTEIPVASISPAEERRWAARNPNGLDLVQSGSRQ